jgi:hypothetical protein
MKLQWFEVQNFRSIIDSTRIRVADITVLIGPNQAGKSSILQGLDKLSFDAQFDPFDLTQLRGISKQYMDGELLPRDIPIATATLTLDDGEQTALRSVLPEIPEPVTEVSVRKTYDNWFRFDIGDVHLAFPSRTVVEHAKRRLTELIEELRTWADPHWGRAPNNHLRANFDQTLARAKALVASELPTQEEVATCVGAFKQDGYDAQLKEGVLTRLENLTQVASAGLPASSRDGQVFAYFLKRLPRTAYFKTYERLEDGAPIAELLQEDNRYPTFRNLLKLADLRVPRLSAIPDEKQKHAYIENASGRVTKLLRAAWEGEDLQMQFRLSEGRLMAFTKDSAAVETLLPPSSGSEGFQWWLGFYITFGASTETEYKNAILLLDDPGVFLHPTGHKDLLKLFETYLGRDVTTVYSTQIPFLIPRDHLDRIRLVTKGEDGKSAVEENWHRGADSDVLAPLRAALGVSLGDSLFAGKNTVVAEGLSERILLYALLQYLGRTGVRKVGDTAELEVLGGNGAPSLLNLALLLQIQNLPYLVLLDNDDEGRRCKESFQKSGIPSDNISMIPLPGTDGRTDADVEDLFPVEMYAKAFSRVHGAKMKIPENEVLESMRRGSGKLTNRAKQLLKDRGSRYDLDKVAIAYDLAGQLETAEELPRTTIDLITKLTDSIAARLKIYAGSPS